MLKMLVGVPYIAETVHCGQSSRGAYEMIVFKNQEDHARIPIWVTNVPCGIVAGSKFVIENISGATIRHIKPSERFDKWQDEFSVNAVVIPV